VDNAHGLDGTRDFTPRSVASPQTKELQTIKTPLNLTSNVKTKIVSCIIEMQCIGFRPSETNNGTICASFCKEK
jgi:hypothetical protein